MKKVEYLTIGLKLVIMIPKFLRFLSTWCSSKEKVLLEFSTFWVHFIVTDFNLTKFLLCMLHCQNLGKFLIHLLH